MDHFSAGSLRFVLADRQLKLFRLGLQSLHKVGGDLLLEALPSKLSLRSINSAHTAFMSVSYAATFFDSYDVYNCDVVQAGLFLKHVLSVFRTQRIQRIAVDLKSSDARATVTLHCDNGLTKEYGLVCTSQEILQTTVDKDAFPTRMVAELGPLNRLLSTFSGGHDEITLVARPEAGLAGQHDKAVQLQSFWDPQKKADLDKSLYTKLAVVDTSGIFLDYSHNSEEQTDVTFNLRDFRAMLSLCEGMGADVIIRLEGPGQPVVLEPHLPGAHGQEDCQAELVLATLMESHSAGYTNLQEPPARQPAGGPPATVAPGARTPGDALANSPNVPGDTPYALQTEPTPGSGGRQASLARGGRATMGRSRFGDEASLAQPRLFAGPAVHEGLQDDPMMHESRAGLDGAAGAAWRPPAPEMGRAAAPWEEEYQVPGDYLGRAEGSEMEGGSASRDYPREVQASGLEGVFSTPPDERQDPPLTHAAPGVIG